jgi:putative heme-binding domain-containing protein
MDVVYMYTWQRFDFYRVCKTVLHSMRFQNWIIRAAVISLIAAAPVLRGQDASDSSEYDPTIITSLAYEAMRTGNAGRGAVVYASPTSACLSCHKVGKNGGDVGPDLSQVGAKQKLHHIVESLLQPQKVVADPYKAIAVLTVDGQIFRGYTTRETDDELEIRDTGTGKSQVIAQDDIEDVQDVGSLMPVGLLSTMSAQNQLDLIAFLADLGKHETISAEAIDSLLAHAHGHHPATYEMPRQPLQPERWPSWQADVNRDRIYDFYAKQARHFRDLSPRPNLLAEYPGLDGGSYGHWGNQSEPTWADGRWNDTDLGSLLSGVFHGTGISVARGVCVRLGGQLSACFDPDTLSYPRVWSGGFVKFSTVRHGFMQGLNPDGPTVTTAHSDVPFDVNATKDYLGFYRHGSRVIFTYRVGQTEYLDAPSVVAGKFHRVVAPRDEHPDRGLLSGGPPQWPEQIVTRGELGPGAPYAVDKIHLPADNPWKALVYCGDHDFLSDGSAIICTMQGDVWRATGLDADLQQVTWRRIASGLHQPLGLAVHDDQIYVIGRDQLTRLHDTNGDDETDFYECFSQALVTSKSGHDFTCGLWRDREGRFYTVSGKEGVMRIAADGQTAEVLATGLRNSDGLGLLPEGTVTIPSSEGDWMPASMVAAIRPDDSVLNRLPGTTPDFRSLPFFGRPGTNRTQPPELPMLYLPRGVDNSSGGQVYVDSRRWGPLEGQLVHTSFGAGTAFLLLRDEFDDWIQGAAVPLTGEFASGAHRAKFNPVDGQLYVSGLAGWGTYTTDDGCFHRVRYTAQRAQLPVGFHVHENGLHVSFSEPVDREVVENPNAHFAQAWNYRYSGAYGSPEYSARQLGLRGHDVLTIESATVLPDGRSVFLEIPELQPVNQLHLLVKSLPETEHDLFMTVHRMDKPFEGFPGYKQHDKIVLPHPMLADLSRPMITKRNPHTKAIQDARPITIAAARNLMYDQTVLRVQAGEPLRLTFNNPDVVPHNWSLAKPGTLKQVGEQCNKLIADPDAAAHHYIPKTDDVLVYTDIVEPYAKFTIYFRAPETPGKYPYLCTFPGHWMVMNGTMIVE